MTQKLNRNENKIEIRWELEIQNWFKKNINKFPKNINNSNLALMYYRDKNISNSTLINEWLIGISQKKYPTYTILYKILKQIRNKVKK